MLNMLFMLLVVKGILVFWVMFVRLLISLCVCVVSWLWKFFVVISCSVVSLVVMVSGFFDRVFVWYMLFSGVRNFMMFWWLLNVVVGMLLLIILFRYVRFGLMLYSVCV